MASIKTCDRCNSAVCDGCTVTCLGCATVQCHGNGLGSGTCSRCYFGILPGWSSWRQQCAYKGCSNRAAFKRVPGSVKTVCHDHAGRPKVSVAVGKIPLTEHVKRSLGRYANGVVRSGELHTSRPLFLSADEKLAVDEMVAYAIKTYHHVSESE